jgi:metal-responsive CopG/Arc/MetJ family transcriptional regulator
MRRSTSSSTARTAISLDGALLREAKGVARRLKVSPSRLFAMAMEEYLDRRANRELLQAINAAHADTNDAEGVRLRRVRQARHRKAVQGEWC